MQSPFPGMDPYLEDPAFWEDFHRSFITYLRDALLEQLPPQYDARIDQRVRLVDVEGGGRATRLPDVGVTRENVRGEAVASATASAVAMIEPVEVAMPELEEERDVWLEVLHLPERSLVTAIEVLSPTNKTGEGGADYRRKRTELYRQHVNLVELDLLLGGERLHFAGPLPSGDYYVSVARDVRRPVAQIYSWRLRDPLPRIPIPLRPPDPDISLNLAAVFKTAYDRGRYARRLQYAGEPPVRLPPEQATWVRERARSMAP